MVMLRSLWLAARRGAGSRNIRAVGVSQWQPKVMHKLDELRLPRRSRLREDIVQMGLNGIPGYGKRPARF